jgi:hypothetical protein
MVAGHLKPPSVPGGQPGGPLSTGSWRAQAGWEALDTELQVATLTSPHAAAWRGSLGTQQNARVSAESPSIVLLKS